MCTRVGLSLKLRAVKNKLRGHRDTCDHFEEVSLELVG